MKKLLTLAMVALIGAFVFTGCDRTSNESGSNTTTGGTNNTPAQ